VDIDQIKRTAEQLEHARDRAVAIIETVRQPLIVLDTELRVILANKASHQVFGKAREALEGQYLTALGPGPWGDQNYLAQLQKLPETGKPLIPREIDTDIGTLGRRTMRVDACPITWASRGGEPMILVALEDVTERKRETERNQQLLRAQAARIEAERVNRRKDEFLAMLAHELRNPLAPILNSLLVLRAREAQPTDIDWALKILERQVRYLSRMIEDLLDVSRVMRGAIQLRIEQMELEPAVSHSLDVVRSLIEGRHQHLTINSPTDPIILDADPVRIEQILINILHNASKYTPEEGEISLTYGREGDEAVIRVVDSGIGIAAEHLREVFDLFMQVDNSLERSLGGLGIGLTLVKSLTELHGGTVEAHSAGLGKGSEFVVRLPAKSARDSDAQQSTKTPAPSGPLRVLIVDDNKDSSESLSRLLQTMGHETRTAATGEKAIETAREYRPSLVLLDIGMPVMNGFEVARRLRAEPEHNNFAIIAISGYGKEEDMIRAREAGFDDYAVKPITIERLNKILAHEKSR
jgi:two-component system CheB/CheR fusion protein